jgi:fibronectin-binding autotransporter adhesin
MKTLMKQMSEKWMAKGGLYRVAAMTALVFAISLPQGAQAANVTPTNESMVLNGDTLVVGQEGAGGAVTVTAASASADSTLTYALGSKVQIGKGANTSVTLQVGNASPSATPILVRSNRAVLVIVPTNGLATSNFGVNEKFKVTGSGANLPTIVNNMVSASIVGRPYPYDDWTSMCFLKYDAVKGFIPVTTEQTGFTGSDNTKIVGYTAGGTLTSNTACYALRFTSSFVISNGVTLTVGNGAGQAGVLADQHNGQSITGGGTLDFGAAELVYHTTYHPNGKPWSSANVHTLSCQVTGSGGITVAIPDETVLKLNNPSNTFSGGLTILAGRVEGDYGVYMDYSHSLGAGVISIANGAGLAVGNRAVLTNNVYLLGGDPNLAAKFSNNTILTNTISGPGNLGCNDPFGGGDLCEIYGSNTFTGGTIIYKASGGKSSVRLYHNSALGAGTGPVVFSNDTSTVTLFVNNYNPKIGTLCGNTKAIVDLGTSASTVLTIGNDNGTGEFAGTINNKGTLVKIGTGTQILSGTNTYYNGSGTIVSNGVLLANNTTGSATGTGAVSVKTNATLGGTGAVNGLVTVASGGILTPGAGTNGTLTLNGGLTLNAGVALNYALGATTGKLRITGGTFTGTTGTGGVSVTLSMAAGFVKNQPYTLIDWTGATASGVDLTDFVVTGGPTSPKPTLSIVGSTLQVVLRPLGTMILLF